jgi:glutamate-1-semialdehyde 2,1-aminomutase
VVQSRSIFNRARNLFPGGVNSPVRCYPPYPRYISLGKGARIRDVEGNSYTDYVLGYGPLILGHSRREVVRSIAKAAERGMLFGAPTEEEVELGDIITEACEAVEMLRFVNSGSEATMHALRLAMHVTGRKKILIVNGGYHGTHPLALESDAVRQIEFNDVVALKAALASREYAAFIVEPVMGNCGLIQPVDGYLEQVRDITSSTDTVFIADEVITGFRTHFGLYTESKGVEADLVTMGKIIGGGMPLAAFGGRRELMMKIRPEGDLPQAGTYSAHPVAVAAALQTMKLLKRINYDRLKDMTDKAASILATTGFTVRYETGMLSVFLTEEEVRNASDASKADRQAYFSLFKRLLREGIYIAPSQDELIFISFAHAMKDIERDFRIMTSHINALLKR